MNESVGYLDWEKDHLCVDETEKKKAKEIRNFIPSSNY